MTMRTQALFYDRPELDACEAVVLEVLPPSDAASGPGLILDRGVFYPEGGGQPCDLGTVAGLPLAWVGYEGDDIVHRLEASAASTPADLPAPGSALACALDAARRADHSEQHTAQHLLSATALRLLGAPTRSFHLGEAYSSIDLDLPELSRADADHLEEAVIGAIREGYRIITHLCPPEDPDSFPLRRRPPEGEAVLRILEIDGIDYTPCAGTHLRSTAAIGAFRILRAERYKGMTRLYFLAGGRAYRDYAALAAGTREMAALAGANEASLPERFAALKARAEGLEADLRAAKAELWSARAGALASSSPPGPVALSLDDEGAEGAQALAKALAAAGRIAVVAGLRELKLVAARPEGGLDVTAAARPISSAKGGKGGGNAALFQAAFPDRSSLVAAMEEIACSMR